MVAAIVSAEEGGGREGRGGEGRERERSGPMSRERPKSEEWLWRMTPAWERPGQQTVSLWRVE